MSDLMSTSLKVLTAAVAIAVLLIGGIIGSSTFLRTKSRHQITKQVAEIRPGMSFSSVASRLGREVQTLTNASEIESYGTTMEPRIVANSTLHLFVHDGIPLRWICIYTDRDSKTVTYASWKDM